jgi:hypothetical protein
MKSIYSRLASLVTVRDLLEPLGPPVGTDEDLTKTHSKTSKRHLSRLHAHRITGRDYLCEKEIRLVMDNGQIMGWFDEGSANRNAIEQKFKEFRGVHNNTKKTTHDYTVTINPNSLIAANMTYFDAVAAFRADSAPDFFFVLENAKLIGTLRYGDLFKLPARACLFSLTLEVEQLALDLCLLQPKKSWDSLTPARQNKARISANLTAKDIEDSQYYGIDILNSTLLEKTMFIDKKTILEKLGVIPKESAHLIKRVFNDTEKIRNAIVHTGSGDNLHSILSKKRLVSFIEDCHAFIEMLRKIYIEQLPLRYADAEKEALGE